MSIIVKEKWQATVNLYFEVEGVEEIIDSFKENTKEENNFEISGAIYRGGYNVVKTDDPTNFLGKISEIKDEKGEAVEIGSFCDRTYKKSFEMALVAINEIDADDDIYDAVFEIRHKVDEASMASVSTDEWENKARKIISEKIAAGLITQETADEIVDYCLKNVLSWHMITDIASSWGNSKGKKHMGKVKKPDPLYIDFTLDEKTEKGQQGVISMAVSMMLLGKCTILIGPKSLGKDVCKDTLGWIFQKPIYEVTGTPDATPSLFYGDKTTDNSAAEKLGTDEAVEMAKAKLNIFNIGKVFIKNLSEKVSGAVSALPVLFDDDPGLTMAAKFEILKAQSAAIHIVQEDSQLYLALADDGMLNLNEINIFRAATIMSIMNTLTDSHHGVYFPGRGFIEAKHLYCTGTMNAGYEGTNKLNKSMTSRCAAIKFGYPDSVENIILASVNGILRSQEYANVTVDKKVIHTANAFYMGVFNAFTDDHIISDEALNIRGIAAAVAAYSVYGGKLSQYMETCVANFIDSEKEYKNVLKQINMYIKD